MEENPVAADRERQSIAPAASDDDRVARVFISSTFVDMQAERDVLVRRVFPALRARLRARSVELMEADLRWGITQEQAENGEILSICLREIDRCRPYFIGLLGARYGWIPPEDVSTDALRTVFPALGGATGRSVTELEILHGVFADPERAHHALFFMRDGAAKSDEGPEAAAKLAALKRRVHASGARVHLYRDPAEIGPVVEQALGALLDARFPEAQGLDYYTRALRLHEAYARERRRLHIGAARYLDAMTAWAAEDSAPPLLIGGASGAGKSALIANWLAARRGVHPGEFVFEHYLGAAPESADPEMLIRRLWVFLDLASGEELRPASSDPGLTELAGELPARLAHAGAAALRKGVGILIVLDGLDKLAAGADLGWLPETLPAGIRLIASALDGETASACAARGWRRLDVAPLADADRETFIVRTLEAWGRDLSAERAARILAHPLAGTPIFLKTVLDELRYSAIEARLDARLGFYLEARDPADLFARVLQRLEEDCGLAFAEQALKFVWAGRAGVEEREIVEATNAPPLTWAVLRNGLGDALRDQDGRVTFSHDFLRNAVASRYLPDAAAQRGAHAAIAARFAAREPDERQAEELPYQLRAAEQWRDLEALLLDLDRFVLLLQARGEVELLSFWNALAAQGCDCERQLIEAFEKRAGERPTGDDLSLGAAIGQFLLGAGARGEPSGRLARRMLAALEAAFGAEHDETIAAMIRLAFILRARGDLNGARDVEERLLDLRQRALGDEHSDTLSAMNNLALTKLALGDFSGARALQERVLEIRLHTPGPQAPLTLTSMNNLALTLREMGEFERAKELHERAYMVMTRVLGSSHPDTLRAATNFARTLAVCGEVEAARDLQNHTLDLMNRVFGPEHPDTMVALDGLAQSLSSLGALEEAKGLHERCLEITARKSGPEHPDTLTSMSNLASTLDDLGEFERALEIQQRVAEINTRDFGAEHPDTLISKNNLAMIRKHAGDFKSAYETLAEVADARVRILGAQHPLTLSTLANIASIHAEAGDLETAQAFQEHVLAGYIEALGPEHPDTLLATNNLAHTLFKAGRADEALQRAEHVLEARALNLGEAHPDTRSSMIDVAFMLKETGEPARALDILLRLQKIQEGLLSEDDPEAVFAAEMVAEIQDQSS